MSCASGPKYLHLNRGGDWPGFAYHGLEPDDSGVLRLRSLPLAAPDGCPGAENCPPGGPAGIALASDGTVFWSNPDRGVVHRIPACEPRPEFCLTDASREHPHRGRPVALAVLAARRTLLVADAEDHRIDLYSLDTLQWLGTWGQPGAGNGQLDTPESLAADESGNLYIAEAGNRRVQKFDSHGQVVPSFWQAAYASTPSLDRPVAVAVSDTGSGESVWVLDAAGGVHALDLDGNNRGSLALEVTEPRGLIVGPTGIYVGSNGELRLLRFNLDGERIGAASGYRGPIAGLAAARTGDIWLAPGCGLSPVVLSLDGAFVTRGLLWGGPFGDGERPRLWQQLRPVGDGFAEVGVHVRWFVHANEDGIPPPDPDVDAAVNPFGPSWQPLAPDAPDVWIGSKATHLWIGALIEGDSLASPAFHNLRVDFDRAGYARHLPAIYQSRTDDLDGLQRFLGLFESFFKDSESQIADLDRLFDPQAAPSEWLDWLAGWLAMDVDQNWSDDKKRRAIAEAWDRHRWRGTARGLREALRLYADLDAQVEEPLLQSSWWALAPEDESGTPVAEASVLGFTTMLAASEPAGAILGSSAVLDQSQLITGEDYGAPLFEATAHEFSVRLFPRQLPGTGQIEDVREVIEREKPAHAHYHVCVVEPRLRVGYQARLGVDAVIGGDLAEPSSLGSGESTGGLILGGAPVGRLGSTSRIGTQTWLGAVPVDPGTECQTSQRRNHGHEA